MTSSSSDETLSSLKLLVDTKSNKVLFAEADHEFAGFLFGLIALPIGFVPKMRSMHGSIALPIGVVSKMCSMHGSIARIYDSIDHIGSSYLEPDFDKSDLLETDVTSLTRAYLKAPETYIVTDGLEVTPMSAISTLALANRFILNKDVEPAEKVVSVDTDKPLALVAAVMCSDTVLSDVFLGSNK